MSIPSKSELKDQIRSVIDEFKERDPTACFVSGMSLAATFLAKCDGSVEMTPQVVVNCVAEVALEHGLVIGKVGNVN